MTDGYIDDIITLMLEKEDWPLWGGNVAPLAVHCTFRPTTPDNAIFRNNVIGLKKLHGEGIPEEEKIV